MYEKEREDRHKYKWAKHVKETLREYELLSYWQMQSTIIKEEDIVKKPGNQREEEKYIKAINGMY